ncbi:MAG: phosphate acyltransferase PlsX [Lachnospiraceae bacterium]|nr:phosphate acyltransferase PlsX [Candidatus Equihabitans merdae]
MGQENIRIVLDVMGGDNAPSCNLEGAAKALKEKEGFSLILAGDETAIKEGIDKYDLPKDRVEVLPTTEIIEMAEPPVMAIRKKKDSSIVKGMEMVKKGEAEAFVSAGSTGAVLIGGQTIVGRLKGIRRPPLCPLIPTEKGTACLADCGANVDARPEMLVQFAQMGSIYLENMIGIKNPRVGILNVGAEEEKGNALVKETFPMLKECKTINFIGSVEARDVPAGYADVIVADAFSGNILLKTYEGTAKSLMKIIKGVMMSSTKTKIGALMIKKELKETLKIFDVSAHGGAPLLGLNGLVVKSHGSSDADEIANSILEAQLFYEKDINGQIKKALELD